MIDDETQTPVRLVEDDAGARFLIYGTERGVRVELRHDGDALWMTQAQMAGLFGRDISVISRHLANVLEEGELSEESNLQFMQIARSTKPVALYSLDMVISVGYRVSSAQATLFRKWATSVLVRFATRGFVVDAERLKCPDENDRLRELREVVRGHPCVRGQCLCRAAAHLRDVPGLRGRRANRWGILSPNPGQAPPRGRNADAL